MLNRASTPGLCCVLLVYGTVHDVVSVFGRITEGGISLQTQSLYGKSGYIIYVTYMLVCPMLVVGGGWVRGKAKVCGVSS